MRDEVLHGEAFDSLLASPVVFPPWVNQ